MLLPLNEEVIMVTSIVVGNSANKVVNGRMVTARGYDLASNLTLFLSL